MDERKYVEWVQDYNNTLHKKEVINEFQFDVQFLPSEYVFLQRGHKSLSDKERKQKLSEIAEIQYYNLTINNAHGDIINYNNSSIAEMQKKDYYFSYLFQEDVSLEENGKTTPCVLYHFERQPTQQGGRRFVLGFETQEKPAEESTLIVNSSIFNSLPIKIKIVKSNIPSVNLW